MSAVKVKFSLYDAEDREVEITAEVTPGDPGRTYGPPEKCYPPSPPEVEVLDARAVEAGADVEAVKAQTDRIEEAALEKAEAAWEEPEPPDDDDDEDGPLYLGLGLDGDDDAD